jgi:hypothetical protein
MLVWGAVSSRERMCGLPFWPLQYGKTNFCRASNTLPCAFYRAHNKFIVCLVLFSAHGKYILCRALLPEVLNPIAHLPHPSPSKKISP